MFDQPIINTTSFKLIGSSDQSTRLGQNTAKHAQNKGHGVILTAGDLALSSYMVTNMHV